MRALLALFIFSSISLEGISQELKKEYKADKYYELVSINVIRQIEGGVKLVNKEALSHIYFNDSLNFIIIDQISTSSPGIPLEFRLIDLKNKLELIQADKSKNKAILKAYKYPFNNKIDSIFNSNSRFLDSIEENGDYIFRYEFEDENSEDQVVKIDFLKTKIDAPNYLLWNKLFDFQPSNPFPKRVELHSEFNGLSNETKLEFKGDLKESEFSFKPEKLKY